MASALMRLLLDGGGPAAVGDGDVAEFDHFGARNAGRATRNGRNGPFTLVLRCAFRAPRPEL